MTPYSEITTLAFTVITDELFEDTYESYQEFLEDGVDMIDFSVPSFKFPKFNIYDTEIVDEEKCFVYDLQHEEKIILAQLVAIRWLERQILSTELTKQEVYASSDFKKTSQASHLSRLISLKKELIKENNTSQMWYNRRDIGAKGAVSTLAGLGGKKK